MVPETDVVEAKGTADADVAESTSDDAGRAAQTAYDYPPDESSVTSDVESPIDANSNDSTTVDSSSVATADDVASADDASVPPPDE